MIDRIFYDGRCGLCHRLVRFLARRDRDGERFRFAPLGGTSAGEHLSESICRTLPDSIVVLTGDGRVLVRSDAVLHALRRLGGAWRALAQISSWAPRPLRDRVYDAIARIRGRLFGRPASACPVLPAELQKRFDS